MTEITKCKRMFRVSTLY